MDKQRSRYLLYANYAGAILIILITCCLTLFDWRRNDVRIGGAIGLIAGILVWQYIRVTQWNSKLNNAQINKARNRYAKHALLIFMVSVACTTYILNLFISIMNDEYPVMAGCLVFLIVFCLIFLRAVYGRKGVFQK